MIDILSSLWHFGSRSICTFVCLYTWLNFQEKRNLGVGVHLCYLRSVWPDLAKFHHLGKNFKNLGMTIFRVYLEIFKIFNLRRRNFVTAS